MGEGYVDSYDPGLMKVHACLFDSTDRAFGAPLSRIYVYTNRWSVGVALLPRDWFVGKWDGERIVGRSKPWFFKRKSSGEEVRN